MPEAMPYPPQTRVRLPSGQQFVGILVTAAAFLAAARVGVLVPTNEGVFSPVWMASGIALAAVLLGGQWMLLGVFVGNLAASATLGLSGTLALLLAIGDTLEPWAAALLLRRFTVDTSFARVRDVFVFACSVTAASTLSAVNGVSWLYLADELPNDEVLTSLRTYGTSTVAGMVLLTPTILALTAGARRLAARRPSERRLRALAVRGAEAIALTVLLIAIGIQVFLGDQWDFIGLFLTFPLFIWATLRFGAIGATTSTTVIAAIALWGTVWDRTLITGLSAAETLTVLQLLVAAVVVANLTLSAVLAERDQARTDLQGTLEVLDEAEQLALVGGWMLDARPNRLDATSPVWCTGELRTLFDLPDDDRTLTVEGLLETLDEVDRNQLHDAMDAAVREGRSFSLEHTVGQDGTRRAVRHVGRVVASERQSHRLVGAVLDITNQRQLDRMKDAFITTTSHELRTPLTSILGFAQTLERSWETLPDADRQLFIEIIADKAARMAMIIDDTLLQSRVDSGAVCGNAEPLLVAPVLERALRDVGLPPSYVVDEPSRAVLANRELLVHIITNFLTNAIKYGREPIEVEAVRLSGGMVEIRVIDRGDGPDPQFTARMFERFERGPGTSEVTGTGLGLSIAQGLAHSMGGAVSFRREAATSVFVVTLPMAPD